jgi:uncharacterized protein (TIGR02217 family)
VSQAVFPTLAGLEWNVTRTPAWKTLIQEATSGKEARAALWSVPSWTWSLSYSKLDAGTLAELQTLVGFFNARQGRFDTFLYTDPDDNSVTDQSFGTGNGAATQFQLVRAFGGFVEPVRDVNTLTNIKKAGVTQNNPADYTISATGLVTFTSAPANGAALTWTGTYYWRCRFLKDSSDFTAFVKQLYENKKVEFVFVK